MTLRNEIVISKENKNCFSVAVSLLQFDKPSITTIRKSLILKLGYKKVIGMQIVDVKNERFDAKKVGTVNAFTNMLYSEKEFKTIAEWVFE